VKSCDHVCLFGHISQKPHRAVPDPVLPNLKSVFTRPTVEQRTIVAYKRMRSMSDVGWTCDPSRAYV